MRLALLLAGGLALAILLTTRAEADDRNDLEDLAVGYVAALLRDDGAWIADRASARSLAVFEAHRLAALYVPSEEIFRPTKENTCYTAADAAIILLLRSNFDRAALHEMSRKGVFSWLLPSINSFGAEQQGKFDELDDFRTDFETSGDARLRESLGIVIAGDAARLWVSREQGGRFLARAFFHGFPPVVWERETVGHWTVDILADYHLMNYGFAHSGYRNLSQEKYEEFILSYLRNWKGAPQGDILVPLELWGEGRALPCPAEVANAALDFRKHAMIKE